MSSAIQFADRSSALLAYEGENGESAKAVPSPSVRGQVEAALDRGETHYTDRPGILLLRKKIATSLEDRFAVSVDASSDLIVTCGVTEARFVAVQQLLQPGQVIAAPALSDRLFGAALLRRVILQDDVAPGTNMVYMASSISAERLRSLLAKTPAGCLVLFEVDEQENSFHPSQVAGFEDRTVTIGGLGDPGWRIGYLASPAASPQPSAILNKPSPSAPPTFRNGQHWPSRSKFEHAFGDQAVGRNPASLRPDGALEVYSRCDRVGPRRP